MKIFQIITIVLLIFSCRNSTNNNSVPKKINILEFNSEISNLEKVDTSKPTFPGQSISVKKNYPDTTLDGYVLYLPQTFAKTSTDYPILVFLQGTGGVGGEIENVNKYGIPKLLLDENDMSVVRNKYLLDSFIVVIPHINIGAFQDVDNSINLIISEMVKYYRGDSRRVYLTGLSFGGMGTWGLAGKIPESFAAVAPMAGGAWMVEDFKSMINLPMWIGHCTGDSNLKYKPIFEATKEIEALGGELFLRISNANPIDENYLNRIHIFSSFKSDKHDAWTEVYNSPKFYKWLLRQKL